VARLSGIRTGFVLALLLAVGASVLIAGNDSHRGVRYLAWGYWRIGDWRYGARFLNVDSQFRASLVGASRAELATWFPDLRPGSSRFAVCGLSAQDTEIRREQLDGEWIGETPWLVVYDRAGHVKDLTLPKGC
jgi:hypothetical protein